MMNRAQSRTADLCRSGPQRPRFLVASERAGVSQLQGVIESLPSDLGCMARDTEELAGVAG